MRNKKKAFAAMALVALATPQATAIADSDSVRPEFVTRRKIKWRSYRIWDMRRSFGGYSIKISRWMFIE
jgi:hypothetical protein